MQEELRRVETALSPAGSPAQELQTDAVPAICVIPAVLKVRGYPAVQAMYAGIHLREGIPEEFGRTLKSFEEAAKRDADSRR